MEYNKYLLNTFHVIDPILCHVDIEQTHRVYIQWGAKGIERQHVNK
jgi:hypothetical protein